jgi:hypothetical protein
MAKKKTRVCMGRPSKAYYAHCKKMEKEFPHEGVSVDIGQDYPVEISTDRRYLMDAMSGCEEIAFDISINNHWTVRTSALAERPEHRDEDQDSVLAFVRQLRQAADMILEQYEAACMDQAQLDRRAAKQWEEPDQRKACLKHFLKEQRAQLASIKAARKAR